jgi:hypothetical protein
MENLSWLPVDPSLDENGAFAFISGKELGKEGVEVKPVEIDLQNYPIGLFKVLQRSYSTKVAANMNIGSGNFSGNYNSFVFLYEAMVYSERIVETPIGDLVYGTRWGAGLRISLTVQDISSNGKVNFGALAANSELGKLNVEYEINGIGINKPEILDVLPGPDKFDTKSYNEILNAVDVVKKYMADNKDDLEPQPFQIFVADERNQSTNIFDESKSVYFAIQNIRKRNSLKTALENNSGFLKSIIRSTYRKFDIIDENLKPSREMKRKARLFFN